MNKPRSGWARAAAATLILSMTPLASVAAPESAPVAGPAPSAPTIAAAAAVHAASAASAVVLAQTAAQTATSSSGSEESFFKTGKGKAVLALFVVAAGYTVFSKYDDRVKSVIR